MSSEVRHAKDCPVSDPNFVPDMDPAKSQCTCDFLKRMGSTLLDLDYDRESAANAPGRQVGGSHYAGTYMHWDWVEENSLGYMEGQITRYVCRWRKKDGPEALQKAVHYVDKLIEMVEVWDRYNHAGILCSGTEKLREEMELTQKEVEILYLVFRWRKVSDLKVIKEKIQALEKSV